jgi:hypothetical protein
MFMVTDPPGTICYTYADCLALIRAGEEIDYEGVTGPGTFTSGGVNAVTQTYTPFKEDGTVGVAVVLDPDEGLAIIEVIAVEAECDPNNVCTW